MKHWNLLIWVPQFGISVVFPLILFIMLAVWLQERWGWGSWVIVAGIFCGLITAAIGFRDTARAMLEASGQRRKAARPRRQLQQPRLVKRSASFL